MDDLGNLVGSLMVSLLKARRMADEETAKMAETYRDNPLLEGLSIPRIRIPELTIDIPVLIEGSEAGESPKPAKKEAIVAETLKSMENTIKKEGIEVSPKFSTSFKSSLNKYLAQIEKSKKPVVRESITRAADRAFLDAQKQSKSALSEREKNALAREIRKSSFESSIQKEGTPPSILANIQTAQVKDNASKENITRMKVSFMEEGLEWSVSVSESGGTRQSLQPE